MQKQLPITFVGAAEEITELVEEASFLAGVTPRWSFADRLRRRRRVIAFIE
jgi:hypothetical protein